MDFEGLIATNSPTLAKKMVQPSAITTATADPWQSTQVTTGAPPLRLASQNVFAPFSGLVLAVNPAIAS